MVREGGPSMEDMMGEKSEGFVNTEKVKPSGSKGALRRSIEKSVHVLALLTASLGTSFGAEGAAEAKGVKGRPWAGLDYQGGGSSQEKDKHSVLDRRERARRLIGLESDAATEKQDLEALAAELRASLRALDDLEEELRVSLRRVERAAKSGTRDPLDDLGYDVQGDAGGTRDPLDDLGNGK